MRVLIACETSGILRRAFAMRGHDAWSVDLLPAEERSNKHIVGDVRDYLSGGWDLLFVAHPPCTRLCNSGVRWLRTPPPGRTKAEMWAELEQGAALFSDCWNAPIKRRAIENPIMHGHAKRLIRNYRPPVQIVQPWWFGDPAFKGIALYVDGLLPLQPTDELTPPEPGTEEHKAWSRVHRMPEGRARSRARSRTYPGFAEACAEQWGGWADERAAA